MFMGFFLFSTSRAVCIRITFSYFVQFNCCGLPKVQKPISYIEGIFLFGILVQIYKKIVPLLLCQWVSIVFFPFQEFSILVHRHYFSEMYSIVEVLTVECVYFCNPPLLIQRYMFNLGLRFFSSRIFILYFLFPCFKFYKFNKFMFQVL